MGIFESWDEFPCEERENLESWCCQLLLHKVTPCRFRYLTKMFKVGAELSLNPAAVTGERGIFWKQFRCLLGWSGPQRCLSLFVLPNRVWCYTNNDQDLPLETLMLYNSVCICFKMCQKNVGFRIWKDFLVVGQEYTLKAAQWKGI